MENAIPESVRVETIRSYGRIPEKAYRWKILILFLFDLFLISIFLYGVYLQRGDQMDITSSNFFHILQQTLYDVFGLSGMFHLGLVIAIHILVFFVLPIITLMIIWHFLPWLFKKTSVLFKILNPFHHDKYRDMKKMNDYNRKWKQKDKARNKKAKKAQPFLTFKNSKLGTVTTRYIAFVHWGAHLAFIASGIPAIYLQGQDESLLYKVIIGVYIVNLIVFWLLRKEPERSIKTAEEKMKYALLYYFEPAKEAQLSALERKVFNENFSASVSYESAYRRGHFKNGFYHRQENKDYAILRLEDLVTGVDYRLLYRTQSKNKYWTPESKEWYER